MKRIHKVVICSILAIVVSILTMPAKAVDLTEINYFHEYNKE